MRLADFLRRRGLTDSAFARQIGVRSQSVGRYANEGRFPRAPFIVNIVRETNGLVRPEDFLPEDVILPEDIRDIVELLRHMSADDRNLVLRICQAFQPPER